MEIVDLNYDLVLQLETLNVVQCTYCINRGVRCYPNSIKMNYMLY
jgi:hypothetical protein